MVKNNQNVISKRVTDVALSLIALTFVIPLILLAAIAIKLESKGPIFFLQQRSGLRGKVFRIFKLRTMVTNAEKVGPLLTQKSDPRITRVGGLLRRTSIDELPQVFNVLKGEMSIVGPRPEVPAITERYTEDLIEVLDYKPGITGISQVNGRASLEINSKIRMEINYQRKASFFTDLVIIIKTPLALISNRGNVM